MSELAPQNFSMSRGNNKLLKVTVTDETGTPIDVRLSSAVVWRLARSARSANVLSKVKDAGVTILTTNAAVGEANCGRMDINLDDSDTVNLDGEYYHDCILTDQAGTKTTIFHGRANFTA